MAFYVFGPEAKMVVRPSLAFDVYKSSLLGRLVLV
jgi:hypothetical protein